MNQKTFSLLSKDQRSAVDWIYKRDRGLLWAGVGSGKTVVALTAMRAWLDEGIARRILVVAPLRVCTSVWVTEPDEWEHLAGHVNVASIAGKTIKTRLKILNDTDNQIVCVNYETLPWLMRMNPKGLEGFDVLWFDEIHKMKSPSSLRFKGRGAATLRGHTPGIKRWRAHFPMIFGMTGTPVSNALLDVWPQVYTVAGDAMFGGSYYKWRDQFFYTSDYTGWKWQPFAETPKAIYDTLGPIVCRLERMASDVERVRTIVHRVRLPKAARIAYSTMQREFISAFDGGAVVALSAGAKYAKLRQAVAGFMYDTETGAVHEMHKAKWDVLEDLVDELQGQQALIVYQFRSQADTLKKMYGSRLQVVSGLGAAATENAIAAWNNKETQLLAIHPQSGGEGLNLHKSGAHHIIMLTEPESAGQYEQVVGRLDRTGQKNVVMVHTIHATDTIDEVRAEVVKSKLSLLEATLEAIKGRQHV